MNETIKLVWVLAAFCACGILSKVSFGQIILKPTWASAGGRVDLKEQFHFDDAAGVTPRLSGNAAIFYQKTLAIISIPKIANHIKLDDAQKKKIKGIYADSMLLAQDVNRAFGDSLTRIRSESMEDGKPNQKRFDELYGIEREKLKNSYRSIDSSADALLEKILSAKQMKRLRELIFQANLLQYGIARVSEDQQDELGLDEDDVKRLKLRQSKSDKDFQQELAELRVQKRNKLLKILTPEQRRKLMKLQGEPVKFDK